MTTVDEMSRGLGRVEGKLDIVLEKMKAMEAHASTLAKAVKVDRHEERLQKLELIGARVGGISASVAAAVGVVVSSVVGYLLR